MKRPTGNFFSEAKTSPVLRSRRLLAFAVRSKEKQGSKKSTRKPGNARYRAIEAKSSTSRGGIGEKPRRFRDRRRDRTQNGRFTTCDRSERSLILRAPRRFAPSVFGDDDCTQIRESAVRDLVLVRVEVVKWPGALIRARARARPRSDTLLAGHVR